MAKRGSKSTKLQAAQAASGQVPAEANKNTSGKAPSDQLRQAVKELGGDDEDLDLIAGIDESDEEVVPKQSKGKEKATDEVRVIKVPKLIADIVTQGSGRLYEGSGLWFCANGG